MKAAPHTPSEARLSRVADVCALATATIGVGVMGGWLLGIEPLKRVLPGLVAMKFNTALALTLAGAALWCRQRPAPRLGLGALVAIFGALALGEYLSGRDLGFDQLFFRDIPSAPAAAYPPGRMAPSTAVCFLLCGLALVRRRGFLAEALALGVAVIAGFALIGYATGTESLSHLPGFISMALHTAGAFVLLAAGILCAVPEGIVAQSVRSRGAARALWLGFGLLTILLGMLGVATAVRLQSVGNDMRAQADFVQPRLEAIRELKIGVLGYALEVRVALAGHAEARQRAADDAAQLQHWLAEYETLARTGRQRELAAGFTEHWRDLHDLAQILLAAAGQPKPEDLARLSPLRRGLEKFIEEQMQPEALAELDAHSDVTLRNLQKTETVALVLLVAGVLIALLTSGTVARSVLRHAQALRASEERLRFALETIHTGTWDLDLANRTALRSLEHDRIFGHAEGLPEWTYETFLEHVLPEDRPMVDAKFRQAMESHGDWNFECRIRHGDGQVRWIWAAGRHRPDAAGAPRLLSGIVQDITERKQAEEQLRGTRDFLDNLLNYANAPIIVWDPDFRITRFNHAFERLTGRQSDEVVGKDLDILLPADGRDEALAHIRRAAAGERWEVVEIPILHVDGSVHTVLWNSATLYAPGGGAIATIAQGQDITRRKHAEEALRESERLYRAIGESIDYGIWICDAQGRNTYASESFLRLMGITQEQCSDFGWGDVLHPDDAEATIAAWKQCVESGGPWYREHRYRGADGQYHPILACGVPVRNERGEVTTWVGINLDISRLKRAEEELKSAMRSAEQAKAAAEQASKAKDHFLAVLSHELRTPLTPVVATVSMLQEDPAFDADTRESLEMIRRNVELEARLIDDLLDLARIERGKVELNKQPIELCTIIRRAVEVCRPDIEARNLDFGVDLKDNPYLVYADAARMQQVFWNLIKNAIKFTPPGGCVGIRCRRVDGYVVAEVNDSGVGIDPEALPRLFNAFEQAERSITRQFGGLGLGLTISKALVEMHGGTIEAHSQGKGKGATIRLRLPVVQPAVEPSLAPAKETLRVSEQSLPPLKVLLVEDHGDTARIMTRLLTRRGCQVQTAGDVATALEVAARTNFDLLISDLGLPDHSGLELIRELRSRGQTLPAIALSGYGHEEDVKRSRDAGFAAHLTKPVDFDQFYRVIAAVTG